MENLELLIYEMEQYEKECAVSQAVAEERRRAKRESAEKKRIRKLLWAQRILGLLLLVIGFTAITYIDREITAYLIIAAISGALIFVKRPLLFQID